MRGYVLPSAACGVSQIFPACGAPKFGVGPTPNLGRLYPCGSQNWDGRKKGGCRHSSMRIEFHQNPINTLCVLLLQFS